MKLLVGLYSLAPLFWVVNTRSLNPVSPDSCHIDAWVRAPDLDPGQVIPGQVRIKANGTCDPISEYSLILRFKERAWAKLPKPDIILPSKPDRQFMNRNISNIDRNNVLGDSNLNLFFVQDPLWGKYTEDISDPSLWDVVEEERIAFESRYKLDEGKGVTHNFALLVPTTDYPPTPWNNFITTSSRSPTTEKGDEHIYLYTVEIKFDNGTTVEIPAGYTAFNTMGRSDNHEPEVVTANFTQRWPSFSSDFNISLTINVTFPSGTSLALGPPDVNIRTSSHDRWIETLSPGNNFTSSSRVFMGCQLSPTSSTSEQENLCYRHLTVQDTDDISNHWNVSTSKSLQVAPKAFPSFDMHYQSFESNLSISIPITRFQEIKNQTQMFDEDFYWVPTTAAEKENNRFFSPLQTEIPIIVSPKVKPHTDIPRTHYLSSHARRPLFIDQSTVKELSQLSIEERDLLAPKSVPIIKRSTENVVRKRYLSHSMYYVGDTWQRKVLNGASGLSDRNENLNTLVIQVPSN